MRILAAVLAALLVAGCLGGEPASDVGTSSTGASLEPAVIVDPTSMLEDGAGGAAIGASAPVWTVGEAWAIRTTDGETEESSFLVVTEASPDSYTLATTNDRMAGYDAIFDVSYVGKIRASDLAGFQGDQAIRYFDFPLADGKTWTTTWDGFEIALAAKKTPRGFDITGTLDGAVYVEYDYTPELKWWSKMRFAEGYGATVDRLHEGWTGEIAMAVAEVVFEGAPAAPVATPGSGMFTIKEGQTMALLTAHAAGSAWVRALRLFDPAGAPHATSSPDFEASDAMGGPSAVFHQEEIPPTPGEWRIVAPTLHDAEGGGFVTIHQVAVAKKLFA